MSKKYLVILLAVTLALAACGLKRGLSLPKDNNAQPQSQQSSGMILSSGAVQSSGSTPAGAR